MKICPKCEAGYPDELTTCPVHGGLLSEIRDLKPGMLVRGTYRIVRKLNQGGMGNVYLAQQILLNELQVLKFLPSRLHRDKEWTDRFLREVAPYARSTIPTWWLRATWSRPKTARCFSQWNTWTGRT